MDNDLIHIKGMFKTNTDLVNKATAGICAEHWLLKPADSSNHLMWVAGHLVVSRGGILRLLGAEWTTPWDSLFARGAKVEMPERYPKVEEIRDAWDSASKLSTVKSVGWSPSSHFTRPTMSVK